MSTDAEIGKAVDKTVNAMDKLAAADEVEKPKSNNKLMRLVQYILAFVIPGGGMFLEAYFVFSVGNLKPIWTEEYPDCWKTHETCPKKLSDSINYTQVGGIIFGQLFLGLFADRLGRKLGSIICASTMLIGGILLTASSGPTTNDLFIMFTVCQFIFGIGVGGEYPVASTSANERAEATKSLSNRRGETVVCVFSMQGWGNLVNTLVIIIIMAAAGQYGAPYDSESLEIVWRLSYAIGLIPLVFVVCWRIWVLKESSIWEGKREALKELNKDSALDSRKWSQWLRYYWHRNFGTAINWFVWDFAFYGNKLFQGAFIKIINPGASLIQVLEYTALNSTVALVGYYFAAFTIDKPWMGRMRMQSMGFLWIGVLFIICAAEYDTLREPGNIKIFQFLYYFSSFWGQFGPNATTWLLPAELAPTEVRSMSHGFSAAVGKAGALVAGVVFALVDDVVKFWISGVCGFVGVALTIIFTPDLTGLDLREGDKRWLAILDGKPEAYTGEAVNPKHLSVFERMLGYGKYYAGSGQTEGGKDVFHTDAETVAGLVVHTKTTAGEGADTFHEVAGTRGPLGKEASFQAKSLAYMG